MAAENPILWLPLTKVSVPTNTGPRNEVSFPEVANRPKPLLWSSLINIFEITTLLADWIGPINKPLTVAKTRKYILEKENKINID